MQTGNSSLSGKHTGTQALSQEEMVTMAQETRRRRDALASGGNSTLNDGGSCTRAFTDESQQFVMLNMANTDLAPRSLKPAFRVLGLFPGESELLAHAEMLSRLDNTADIRMVTSHDFYSIPVTKTASMGKQKLKVNRNLTLHQQKLQSDTDEFQLHKAELTQGRTPCDMKADTVSSAVDRINENKRKCGVSVEDEARPVSSVEGVQVDEAKVSDEEAKEAQPTTTATTTTVATPLNDTPEDWASQVLNMWPGGKTIPSVHRMAEVRHQSYISYLLLEDYEDGTEPAMCVLAAFNTEEQALAYNKYVASKKIDEHDLHVHAMYEWIYPHVAQSKALERVEQVYRNSEQDSIMRHMRKEAQDVADFTQHFTSRGLEAPVIEVINDLTDPAQPITHERRAPVGSGLNGDAISEMSGNNEVPMPVADVEPAAQD